MVIDKSEIPSFISSFRKLNHPCLVQLYGICIGDGKPIYLITEYMARGDLLSYLKLNRATLQRDEPGLKSMCQQVCILCFRSV